MKKQSLLGLFCMLLFGCNNSVAPMIGSAPTALQPCSDKPNCVCSIETRAKFQVKPISIVLDQANLFEPILPLLNQLGEFRLERIEGNYLHGTFTSRLFRFKDDLELLYHPDQKLLHIRSASRVGYSDLGVNRKRINQFRRLVLP